MTGYRDLIVWKKAISLAREIYVLTERFPKSELYGLTSQMRRSSVSIPSNLAEGSRRRTKADFRHFVTIAFASGAELETQIEISRSLPFGDTLDFSSTESLLSEVMKMLNKLEASLQN